MPIERREIRFRDDELLDAIGSYGRHTPGVLPDGKPQRVMVDCDANGAPSVTVLVALNGHGQDNAVQPEVADVHLSAETILDVMIWFCRQEGIPMPRFGSKQAAVLGGLLALVIDYRGSGQDAKAG